MKRRHHLEWHRIRNNRSPDWRRRRDRREDVSVRVARTIRSAGTTLVDPLNGSLMGDPSFVKMTTGSTTLPEVVVILATDPGHDLLEAGQLVFEVLYGVVENVQFGILLSNHLAKVATLTES